jgi:hypothetical protein
MGFMRIIIRLKRGILGRTSELARPGRQAVVSSPGRRPLSCSPEEWDRWESMGTGGDAEEWNEDPKGRSVRLGMPGLALGRMSGVGQVG